ncbi:hypothetical protein IAI18_05690 [Acetobacteraceae bacterium H6797]|nr:hypothetical protein [Acetobacteraceae bacterium H6797]
MAASPGASPVPPQGGMAVDELARALWAARWRLLAAMALLFGLSAAVVLTLPRSYVAQAIVAPAESTGLATSTIISPSLLASPGGLLDNRPSGNFAIYLAALRSPEAAAMLVRDTPLLSFLAEQRESGPGGLIRDLLDIDGSADLDDARRWLEKRLSVTQSLTSITWTLELSHPDREAARDMLARLHAFAEAKVRNDLLDLTRRRMQALQQRLDAERDLFMRNPLFELLAQHQRAYAAVLSDEVVAARVVSPASVELKPSLPNRPLLLALLTVAVPLAALLGAACLILLRGRRA